MPGRRQAGATRWLPAWQRLALGCALLAAAAPLLATAHLAATQHVTCAEHGELVETNAPAWIDGGPGAGEASLHAAPAVATHGHAHCFAGICRRSSGLVRVRPTAPVATADAAVARSFPAAPPLPSVRLFRLAPKNSPSAV